MKKQPAQISDDDPIYEVLAKLNGEAEYEKILQTIDGVPKDQLSSKLWFKRTGALIKLSRYEEAKEEIYLASKRCTDPEERYVLYEMLADISSHTHPEKIARVNKRCVAGFIMASIGAILFFGILCWGAYYIESHTLVLTILFFLVIELLTSFIVSIKGVISAARNRDRFIALGVFGIIFSGIPLTIAMNVLPLLIFRESPPSPPPTTHAQIFTDMR